MNASRTHAALLGAVLLALPAASLVAAGAYDVGKREYDENCASCHGPQALGQAHLPRLAGQSPTYLLEQLRQFAQGGRTNDQGQMHATTRTMSQDEMAAVAEYLGSR